MTHLRHFYTHTHKKKTIRQWILQRLMSHFCADNRDMWCVCVRVWSVCLCPVEGESCVMLLSNRLSVSSTNKPATLSPNILFLQRPELLVPSSSSCPLPTSSLPLSFSPSFFLSVFSFWLWKSNFWTCYQLQRTNTSYQFSQVRIHQYSQHRSINMRFQWPILKLLLEYNYIQIFDYILELTKILVLISWCSDVFNPLTLNLTFFFLLHLRLSSRNYLVCLSTSFPHGDRWLSQ